MNQQPDLKTLTDFLIEELAKAVARPNSTVVRTALRQTFGKAARKFSQLALDLDRVIAAGGLAAGARWVLPRFARSCEAQGAETIPPDGPLVIASNHPGSIDSVAISAHVERPDYKIIIGNIPFFQHLPNLRDHALFAPEEGNIPGRMRVVREAIRHLQAGGALLIFARGRIEADPSFMPNPEMEFPQWSRSLEIFLRHIPETRVLVTIVSGVIARRSFQHPITWLRKARPDRQRLAFMYQMVRQMLAGQEFFGLTPRVTFGEIIADTNHALALQAVEGAAARTLDRHLAWAT
jgi:hypothetical protein